MQKSPFAPLGMQPPLAVRGVRFAAHAANLRYQGRDDVALIELADGTSAAGIFTQSTTAGHPIKWCRNQLKHGSARAVLINAGNANVFRGSEGDDAVERSAASVAQSLNCESSDVFIASTGVIGERLAVEKLCDSIPALVEGLSNDRLSEAASAIMTTDTFPKWASASVEIDGQQVAIAGIAKGSGMIAPDMATMLAFVVTDANIRTAALQELLRSAGDRTFNAITVDSDTSTSDTLMLFATNQAGNRPIYSVEDEQFPVLRDSITAVMGELAMMVIKDGEGIEKLISVQVSGAVSDESARQIGKSIANSPLVKTAIAGEDANWGRVIMAIGKSGEPIQPEAISIAFGGYDVAVSGSAVADIDEDIVDAHLQGREIDISVIVGNGYGSATIWTCDLTHRYIDINADYRS